MVETSTKSCGLPKNVKVPWKLWKPRRNILGAKHVYLNGRKYNLLHKKYIIGLWICVFHKVRKPGLVWVTAERDLNLDNLYFIHFQFNSVWNCAIVHKLHFSWPHHWQWESTVYLQACFIDCYCTSAKNSISISTSDWYTCS